VRDVLVIDRPEQLKALGHPLRVRALEMLGGDENWQLTNRELAQKLGVDPGHLHFHVRMLVKAGLIEPVEGGRGREKPYQAVAREIRVARELLAAGGARDLQAAILDEVQRGHAGYAGQGRFRSVQVTLRLDLDRAIELMREFITRAREAEDDSAEELVLTTFAHPPATRESG